MTQSINLDEITGFNLKKVRRELHQIPELAFEETKTTDYLEMKLSGMGFTPYRLINSGLIVYIDAGTDQTTAFRADIDALPINEQCTHDFKSTNGNMHACGHDGHMTILLGYADYLAKHIFDIKKNILLIFQPAEESIGGAKKLIEANLIQRYKVDKIFGLHLFPELRQGVIASKPGAFMARNAEINITIYGKDAHGAMPHLGIDSIQIAANLLTRFQQLITRNYSPFEPTVLSFGKIEGGNVRNILAGKTRLEGTLRTFSDENYDRLLDQMKTMIQAEETLHNIQIDFEVIHGYPAVINDEELFNLLKHVTPESRFQTFKEPFMLSEDFSFYQREVPGLFFYLGTKNETKGFTHPLHSPYFDFDEAVLKVGVQTFVALSKALDVIK